MKSSKPEDLFRAEKERALTVRDSQHARLLAEAKAAFDKLMAEGQAARKSGRPRKHPLPPLKTSSSRPPVKPLPTTPAAAAPAPAPVPEPVPVPVKAVQAAQAKPVPAKAATKVAKAVKPKKAAKAATKAKPKAKRSSRR